jgi:GT2 family glycosyltransferase
MIRNTAGRAVEILADPSSGVAAQISRATGDHLLFVHADVEPSAAGWLDALLEFSQQPPIGAVAPFLIRRDGTIDHAGLVLGTGEIATSAFAGEPATTRGHLSNALDVRNCAALSGACLLTRRDAFDRVGGLDLQLPPGLAAVDYSMRLREGGLRLVVTPHARLWRGRASGRVIENDPVARARLRVRWRDQLDRDPFYNLNFDRQAASYRLPDAELTCPTT